MKLNACICHTLIAIIILVAWASPVQVESSELQAFSYFSIDYQEARNKFLEAAEASGARVESFDCPVIGPEGEVLATDIAVLGASRPKAVLVLVSGTHGVEGFAGSAIQVGLLREGITSMLGLHVRVVMIHAINPYGFTYFRRVNEDNVDLNRNFVDHSAPYPRNLGYEELADAIAPENISIWQNTKARLSFFWFLLNNGKLELRRALTKGQYSHPKGLFFGGHSETWSNKIIKEIVHRHLSGAKRVVVVDFHTGLGPYGHGELIMSVPQHSQAYKRAVEWWGARVKTTVTGDSVSPNVYGALKLLFPRIIPVPEVTATSLEFGTFPPDDVLWALRAENWLHHYGGKNHPDSKEIKSELLRVFYPKTDDWKRKVWSQGKEVVEQALFHMN